MNKDKITYEQRIIFEKLRRERKEESSPDISLTGAKGQMEQIHKNVDVMQHNIMHNYYCPVDSGGSVKQKLKLASRKSVAWFMRPAFERQSLFNEKTSASILNLVILMQDVYARDIAFNDRIDSQEQRINDREQKINGQEQRINDHEQRINVLEQKIYGQQHSADALSRRLAELERELMRVQGVLETDARLLNMGEGKPEDYSRDSFIKTVYAQSGEDAIIDYILRVTGIPYSDVTYLDLGANHAKELSNTYFLYLRRASGVLVEANPELIQELSLLRIRDTVLNRCISPVSGEKVEFYIFNGDGLSTPDKKAAETFCEINPGLKIEKTVQVETISVNDIIAQYMSDIAPTVLSIDIEGMEEEIISSIDFDKYRPLIIISEMVDYSLRLAEKRDYGIARLLEERGYFEYAFTGINSIFVDKRFLDRLFGGNK